MYRPNVQRIATEFLCNWCAIEGQSKQGGSRWQYNVSFYHASQEEQNWQKKLFFLHYIWYNNDGFFVHWGATILPSQSLFSFFLFSKAFFFDFVFEFWLCTSSNLCVCPFLFFLVLGLSAVPNAVVFYRPHVVFDLLLIWKPKTSSSASWWLPSSSSSSGAKAKATTHNDVRKPFKHVASNPPQHLVRLNVKRCPFELWVLPTLGCETLVYH